MAYGPRPSLKLTPSHPPVVAAEPAEGAAVVGETARKAFEKAMGTSVKRNAPRLSLPGPDQLSVDGRSRRVVLSYKKDLPVEERQWAQNVVGGFHEEWNGGGKVWLEWARAEYRIANDGRLTGDRSHPMCPLAAIFWWECDAIVRRAGKEVGVPEARFVFDKLLTIEAEYPVTHFVASDGSRKEGDPQDMTPRVGRVAISVSRDAVRVLGGRMETAARGFERHSYEAETEAFLDHLADCENSVTVFVTDCLSGSQAGTKYKSRTDAHKAGCYRCAELDNVDALERKHRAVLYLWVHSHVGITPNEAADALADGMRDGDLWSELRLAPSRFQLARVSGLKRGVGIAVYEMAQGMVIGDLAKRVEYTLLPGVGTWELAVKAPHRAKLMQEADFNLLSDARANRLGLMGDRSLDDPAPMSTGVGQAEAWKRREYRSSKSSWEWYRQAHCACPVCSAKPDPEAHCQGLYGRCNTTRGGGVAQTRWHALIECRRGEVDGELDELRRRASAWLVKRVGAFDVDANLALQALQQGGAGLDRGQRWMALRFLLGVPMEPKEKEDKEDLSLMAGYAKGFMRHVCSLLRAGARAAEKAVWGGSEGFRMTLFARFGRGAVLLNRKEVRTVEARGGGRKWAQGGRRAWLRWRGLKEQWESREWSRKALSAWRVWVDKAGPSNTRMRRQEAARGGARTKGREDAAPGEGEEAFDAWTQARAMAAWRKACCVAAGPERAVAADNEVEAMGRLIRLRHAGMDPNPRREREAAEERKEEARREEEVAAVVERLVKSVSTGSAPSLRRVGEARAAKMGRRDLADQLADSGRAPLRGGAYAVDRVLDVRKAGKALQVLVRWRGQHEDSWQVLASCNAGTKREAWALAKRKFPPRADKRPEVSEVRPERSRVHLKRGGADPLLHLRKRLCGAGGRPLRAGRPLLSPLLPTYSPGLAGPFGAGAGRSKRTRAPHLVGAARRGGAEGEEVGGVAIGGARGRRERHQEG